MKEYRLRNSNGDIDPTATGYDYAIRTVTAIRAKTLKAKYFEVPPADYMPVIVGEGAWRQESRTNFEFLVSGDFESMTVHTGQNDTSLPSVDVAAANKSAKHYTFAGGYNYSIIDLEMALASDNWDIVAGKTNGLKKVYDLGIQKVSFLGRKGDTLAPGLLTNSDVTIDLTTITQNISAMDAATFQTFVAAVIGAYRSNANYTAYPNRFVMTEDDFNGMATATSSGFPIGDKITYLENAFKKLTKRSDFQVLPLAYGNAAQNAGYINGTVGKNRYALYNDDPETIRMDIPVPFQFINPTPRGISFEGAAVGQYTGAIVYRTREVMYFDHS